MAFLINRKAPSRIECLYSLVKFLYSNYGEKSFTLDDCMYSRDEDNIHHYCSLIVETDFGYKCPYKESPLSDAGCYITNGKLDDSTKKKEVGNTINALHGMGFLHRDNHKVFVTQLGVKLVSLDLFSLEAASLIKNAVLSYGPVVGVIDEIDNINEDGIFNASEIAVGYPSTEELVLESGSYITISSGSTTDANTRSRSCYLSWLVTAGVIEPVGVLPDNNSEIPYDKYRSFLNADTLKARKYRILISPQDIYEQIKYTKRPLDYVNLTKLTRALRENGQAPVREVTMRYENRIKNRRFAIIYLLNEAYKNQTFLDFEALLSLMLSNPEMFVISNDSFREVLLSELHIANVTGIPFFACTEEGKMRLFPKLGVSIDELSIGAPSSLIKLLKTF